MEREDIMQSRHVVLARRPEGLPVAADFRVETRELPPLADGRVMIEVLYTTANPGTAAAWKAAPVMRARSISARRWKARRSAGDRIEKSGFRGRRFALGSLRLGRASAGLRARHAEDSEGHEASQRLGRHSQYSGLTAYFGLRDVAAAKTGDTVLISSAAGAVGATAGQIARIMGCRVIGLASGDERRRWLHEEAKFDAVIDRREAPDIASLEAKIAAVAPDGIDVYFDNVGGYVLDAAIAQMKQRGRIVICGQLADFSSTPGQRYGTRRVHEFIGRRLRMEGLVVFDFADRYAKAHADMIKWIEGGELKYREHVVDGLDGLPELFCAQLRGEIIGRPLARLVS